MGRKVVKNMLATLGTPTTRMKDSDGDGVPNHTDCEPYNPRKQGLIHDVGKKVVRKTLRGRFKYRAEKFIERKQKESEAVKKVKIEERQKQRIQTAQSKEETRGERARQTIKKGGIVRQFTSGFVAPSGVRNVRGGKKQKKKLSPLRSGESIHDYFDKRFSGGF